MTKLDITAELISIWKAEYEDGASLRKIGEKHGVSKATVGKHLTGIVIFREKSPNKKHADTWYQLYLSGWSKSDIAKKYNVSHSVVTKILSSEKGVEKKEGKKAFLHLLPTFISLYKDGFDLTDISNKTGVSRQTILNYLNEAGVEVRSYSESSRIYKTNENYFKKIDSNEKAYILGLVFSSGSLIEHYNSYSLQIVIRKEKFTIIKEIFKAVSDKKENEILYSKSDNCYKDRIFSKEIFDSLEKLGLSSRDNIQFPSIGQEYSKYFLIGYLKGKSSLYEKRNDFRISVKPHLSSKLKDMLISIIGITSDKIKEVTGSESSLVIYNNESVEKVKAFLKEAI